MSFDHVIELNCTQTITILYKYFHIWKLDFRLNNINYCSSIFIFLSLKSVLIFIIIAIIIKLLSYF